MKSAKEVISTIIKEELKCINNSYIDKISDKICEELSLDGISTNKETKQSKEIINPLSFSKALTRKDIVSGTAFISTLDDKSVESSLEDVLFVNKIYCTEEEKKNIIKDTYKILSEVYKDLR